jgi:hypothetical protein
MFAKVSQSVKCGMAKQVCMQQSLWIVLGWLSTACEVFAEVKQAIFCTRAVSVMFVCIVFLGLHVTCAMHRRG